MAMTPGSVTVNDDETHSGTGLALAMYEALKAVREPQLPDPSQLDAPLATAKAKLAAASEADRLAAQGVVDSIAAAQTGLAASRLPALRSIAAEVTAMAGAIVLYLQANAELVTTNLRARVSTSDSVGRTPDPNDPNTAIQPPVADVDLAAVAVGAVRIQ